MDPAGLHSDPTLAGCSGGRPSGSASQSRSVRAPTAHPYRPAEIRMCLHRSMRPRAGRAPRPCLRLRRAVRDEPLRGGEQARARPGRGRSQPAARAPRRARRRRAPAPRPPRSPASACARCGPLGPAAYLPYERLCVRAPEEVPLVRHQLQRLPRLEHDRAAVTLDAHLHEAAGKRRGAAAHGGGGARSARGRGRSGTGAAVRAVCVRTGPLAARRRW